MAAACVATDYIKPLVYNEFVVPESGVRFSASCFEGKDWSLGGFYESQDAYRKPELAARLERALAGLSAQEVYAPNPTGFNGRIILPRELDSAISLGGGLYLYRRKDPPADGTFLLGKGQAFVFSAGGCGLVVFAYDNDLIAAHAGRESVLDRRRVTTDGAEEDRSTDLVDEALIMLGTPPAETGRIHVWPLYFIKPTHFAHRFDDPDPRHIPYNKGAARFLPKKFGNEYGWQDDKAVYLDLPRIVRAQCVRRGVPTQNVHLDHAYLPDELPTTRNGGGRYLVAAVRQA